MKEPSVGMPRQIHMHVKVRHRKVHSSSSSDSGKGNQETSTSTDERASASNCKDKLIKSTVTIRKIIVRRTLSSTHDQLIIRKSRVMQTKKIVTIRSALI
jgi:hypothetical protein